MSKPIEKDGVRIFETGSIRNSDVGKLEYSKYIHPLNEYSFAKYMRSHQFIGGERRAGDNWQKGIPYKSLYESLVRHMEGLKLLAHGYGVIEISKDGEYDIKTTSRQNIEEEIEKYTNEGYDVEVLEFETQLNAIRFNSEAMKLQILTGNPPGL